MAGVIIFNTTDVNEMYVCRSPDRHCGGGHFEKFYSDSSVYITYHRAGPHDDPEDQKPYRERAWSKTRSLINRWYREHQMEGIDEPAHCCQLTGCGFEGKTLSKRALVAHYVDKHPGTELADQAIKFMIVNGLEDMVRANRQPRNNAAAAY